MLLIAYTLALVARSRAGDGRAEDQADHGGGEGLMEAEDRRTPAGHRIGTAAGRDPRSRPSRRGAIDDRARLRRR